MRWFETDVSGLASVTSLRIKLSFLESLTLEDRIDREYQNVGFKPPDAA
jgi:hypothetical protein